MRKLLLLVGLVSFSAVASGLALDTAIRKEFTNCESGGSAAQTLAVGNYLFRVTDKDVFVCLAASASTCASGGEKFPMGTVIRLTIGADQVSVSCRSSDSTGDAIFTRS